MWQRIRAIFGGSSIKNDYRPELKRYTRAGFSKWLAGSKAKKFKRTHDESRGVMLQTRTLDIIELIEGFESYLHFLQVAASDNRRTNTGLRLTLDHKWNTTSVFEYFCKDGELYDRTNAHHVLCETLLTVFALLPEDEHDWRFRAGAVYWQDLSNYIDAIERL